MKRAVALLFTVCVAYGQRPDPTITFEVASLKASPPADPTVRPPIGCTGGPGTSDPGRFLCQQKQLAQMVAWAFNLKGYQWPLLHSAEVFSWPTATYYDVAAKVPPDATAEQLRIMLQNLLVDRFKLAYHFEKKDSDVYELVVAKGGPKLKESQPNAASAAAAAQPTVRPAPGPPPSLPDGCPVTSPRPGISGAGLNGVVCETGLNASIAQLATYLSGQLKAPVTDVTGLKGAYDFKFRYSPASFGIGPDTGDAPTLFAAVQADLGVRLEKKKAPIDVFVVDHVEKIPEAN